MTSTDSSSTDGPVLDLAGDVDPAAIIALQRRVIAALGAGHRRVIVDLGAITVLGAPTVGLLCGALRRMTRRGADTLVIRDAPPHLHHILELCAIAGVELEPVAAGTLGGGPLFTDPTSASVSRAQSTGARAPDEEETRQHA